MTKLEMQKDIYEDDEFKVQIGKTQTIIPMQERMCPAGFVFKLTNSEIVVGGEMSGVDWPVDGHSVPMPPGQTSRKLSWRRSKDGGQTWCETPSWVSYSTYQFPDSEIIQMSGRWWQIEDGRKGMYSTALFRSVDSGYTFKKKRVPIIGVPKLAKVTCQHSYREHAANVNHQMVRLHDDSLLASVYGKFKSDIKDRTFIIQSVDRGKTWSYLSTVAFDLTKGNRVSLEGFNEPDLLVLPSGEILCFMRSGSKQGESLYMCRSKDDGKTWSHADPIADRGVYPTACLMANGVIVVAYGRPGDWLTFSPDQGETWINHFCFNQTHVPYDCGNYCWIEEIAPDILLVIYSRTDPNDCMISEIMGTYVTVKPKKRLSSSR